MLQYHIWFPYPLSLIPFDASGWAWTVSPDAVIVPDLCALEIPRFAIFSSRRMQASQASLPVHHSFSHFHISVPDTSAFAIAPILYFLINDSPFAIARVSPERYRSTFICKSYFSLSSCIVSIIGEAWCTSRNCRSAQLSIKSTVSLSSIGN